MDVLNLSTSNLSPELTWINSSSELFHRQSPEWHLGNQETLLVKMKSLEFVGEENRESLKVLEIWKMIWPKAKTRNLIVPPSTASQESTSTAPRCSQIIWGRGRSLWGRGGSLQGRGNLRGRGGQVFRGRGGHNILGPPPPPSRPPLKSLIPRSELKC